MVVGIIVCFIVVSLSAYGIMRLVNNQSAEDTPKDDESSQTDEPEQDIPEEPPVPEKVLPNAINFQPFIDEWVAHVGGNRSVIIYDLDRDEIAGTYNTEETYNIASLYKLFVVYEGYRRLNSGEWNTDEVAGYTGYTILECLDLAIRESHSHIVSNPNDILKIMKLFYTHPDITNDALIARMKDSFLVQPPTIYNWRQGLPSGFSEVANVYNKVGWDFNPDGNYWNIYHDAAIIEYPANDRHFVVIVMTNRIPFQRIREFGNTVDNVVIDSLATQ